MHPKRTLCFALTLALTVALALPGSTLASPVIHLIVVTNLDDSGPGSLRDALDQANADQMPSKIVFMPLLYKGTLQLDWELPGLWEDHTTIDGDINHDLRPDIAIDGANSQGSTLLTISSSHNLIRGLVFSHSSGSGIRISRGSYNRMEYCYVGTDFTGTQDQGNAGSGIDINGASDNQIGPGNIVAYNATAVGPNGGIAVLDELQWEHLPDFAGLTPDYTGLFPQMDFPNTSGPFTSVDGITPTDAAGHPFGDTFGARFTGKLAVSAAGDYTFGLYNVDDSLQVFIDDAFVAESGCMTPVGCNDLTVSYPLTEGEHDVLLKYLDGPGAAGFHLEISGPGGADFSYEGQPGLWGEFFQLRVPAERNRITRNSIFANGRIGIELDSLEDWNGVNILDPGDGDMGPNTAMNYPVLTSVHVTPGRTLVKGTIDTPNPRKVTLEFFANLVPQPGPDPSGYGEGQIFIGTAKPTSHGEFTAALVPVPPGTWITATATDNLGNTSEFAENIQAIRSFPHSSGVLYVNQAMRVNGNGSRSRPFKTIQAAVDAAQVDDTIKVAVGTYDENIVISGKTLTIQGGYHPRNWKTNGSVDDTVIDGGGRHRTILIIDGANVTLEGLAVVNGNNPCQDMGGGGGILVYGPTTEATLQRLILSHNIATPPCGGGGIEIGNGAVVSITNSMITDNSANDGGGICAWTDSRVSLINTTVANNSPDGIGSWPDLNAQTTLWNTLVWGNSGGPDVYGTDEIYSSLIGVDPLFVNAAQGNYHLSPGSPAIDAGTSLDAPATDIDGDPRPMGASVDIGADEFHP